MSLASSSVGTHSHNGRIRDGIAERDAIRADAIVFVGGRVDDALDQAPEKSGQLFKVPPVM